MEAGCQPLRALCCVEGRWWQSWQALGWERTCQVSQALILLGGTGKPGPTGVPPPDLVLWEGDLACVCIPGCRSGGLSGVVPTCSVHSAVGLTPGRALSRHFRLFSPKVQEMGKKNDFVYLLSAAFWTGAAYRGPRRGLWHLFQASEAQRRGGGPDLGQTLVSPAVRSGGLEAEA